MEAQSLKACASATVMDFKRVLLRRGIKIRDKVNMEYQIASRCNQAARASQRLSSPHAESARAVTGRRCPHSGEGEDFLSRQPNFFYGNSCNLDRKVEKSFPRWEINRHVEG